MGTVFADVHVVPPFDDNWTHSMLVPPLLLRPAAARTVTPLIEDTGAGTPEL